MSRRGFTLLEVMVATLIMAVAVVGLLSGITTSMRNASKLTDYDRAVLLARSKMDELLMDRRLPRQSTVEGPFPPSELGGGEGGWRARLSLFERPEGIGVGQPILERLELEVWWNAGGQRHSFGLEAYRSAAAKPEDARPQ